MLKRTKATKIKTKITMVIMAMIVVLSAALSATGGIASFNSAFGTLDKTIVVLAEVASERVSYQLQLYKSVATETGCIKRMSDETVSREGKLAILDEKVLKYGYTGADYVDMSGISQKDGANFSSVTAVKSALGGAAYVSEPIISQDKKITFYVAAPIWNGGVANTQVTGAIVFVLDGEFLNSIMRSIEVGETGGAYMIDNSGTVIAHTQESLVLERDNTIRDAQSTPSLKPLADIEEAVINGRSGHGEYTWKGDTKVCGYAPVPDTNGWGLVITVKQSEFMTDAMFGLIVTVIIVAVALLLGYIIAMMFSKAVAEPVIQCADRLALLAKGDLASEVPTTKARDETGELLKDLSISIDSFNENFGGISIITEEVASGSAQVADGAQALAQGASEQAASVEQMSTTLEDIARSVSQTAQLAHRANELTVSVEGEMKNSSAKMDDMVKAINEISASSEQISRIIKTIEDIAFQTNILALNAAVEAARAGSAGKGFAVVADEVRNLASKSASAASNTNDLITGSISVVNRGVEIADSAYKSLSAVIERAQEVSGIVSQISKATEFETEAISQTSQGVSQISSVVQTTSATAEESAAASEQLSEQVAKLREMMGMFKLREREGTRLF